MAIEVDGPAFVASDRDLVYSARARCPCGAGLAYRPGLDVAFDCADLLTGRAIPVGLPGARVHMDRLPFAVARVLVESPWNGTTRPGGLRESRSLI